MTGWSAARIGLVGLGRMGGRLAAAAADAGHAVVSAFDTDPDCYALSTRPELRAVYTREPSAFWSRPVDLLLVATTAPSHVGYLNQGLARGVRRFMVEKPFCTSLAEGEDARAAAARAGARVVVNHGRRYCPNYAALAALDGSPELGSLRAASASLGAGGLGCAGVHLLELFSRLFGGPPERVSAAYSGAPPPNPRGAEFDDPGACALLVWPDGRRAVLDMADDTGVPLRLEFRFTYGRVAVDDEAKPWRVLRRAASERTQPLSRYGLANEEMPLPGFVPFGMPEMTAAAIEDALADGAVRSGIEPALEAFRTFVAIRKSADSGATTWLPLDAADEARRFAIP
jgi:predicted dehydrogenase